MSDADDYLAYLRFVQKPGATVRDLDLDALADGIAAHRDGKGCHENPHGTDASLVRLSWTFGWNERALKHG